MSAYLLLFRGINVGGKNIIPMASLKSRLKELGFDSIETYIASGNVILQSKKKPSEIKEIIEKAMPKSFKVEKDELKVLVLTRRQLQSMIDDKPSGFGDFPEKYHSDAIFMMDIAVQHAISLFKPREGVDTIWPGNGVIYSQRLSALRTKSRLKNIMGTPEYKSMTIRNWRTTTKLLDLLMDAENK
jgi:uncharacterized protein (DUF1697 family)